MIRLFVYGTLKRGLRNHHYCKDGIYRGEACLYGKLYDLPEGYPALMINEKRVLKKAASDFSMDYDCRPTEMIQEEYQVFGELFEFQRYGSALKKIDWLEGFDPQAPEDKNLYQRVLVTVKRQDQLLPAWTYIMTKEPRGNIIPHGVYKG